MRSPDFPVPGLARPTCTEVDASVKTRCETLPKTNLLSAVCPCEPTTMRSADDSRAQSSSSKPGEPFRTWCVTRQPEKSCCTRLVPRWAKCSASSMSCAARLRAFSSPGGAGCSTVVSAKSPGGGSQTSPIDTTSASTFSAGKPARCNPSIAMSEDSEPS